LDNGIAEQAHFRTKTAI